MKSDLRGKLRMEKEGFLEETQVMDIQPCEDLGGSFPRSEKSYWELLR